MGYEVSEDVLKRTDCHNGFHCLSGDMEGVCAVVNPDWKKVVVTDCPERGLDCAYCRPFQGPQGLCVCPTRIELFRRHGV